MVFDFSGMLFNQFPPKQLETLTRPKYQCTKFRSCVRTQLNNQNSEGISVSSVGLLGTEIIAESGCSKFATADKTTLQIKCLKDSDNKYLVIFILDSGAGNESHFNTFTM